METKYLEDALKLFCFNHSINDSNIVHHRTIITTNTDIPDSKTCQRHLIIKNDVNSSYNCVVHIYVGHIYIGHNYIGVGQEHPDPRGRSQSLAALPAVPGRRPQVITSDGHELVLAID